jgi:tetratricopeptide (TPR) repeat protein
LVHLGKEAEAIPDLERILGTQPENPEALLSYGLALARTGQSDTATEVLDRVLEMETAATMAAIAHVELAEMLETDGAFDEALAHFETAAELVPEYKPPQLGLARALIRAGRPEDAVSAYDLILVLDPADEEARLGRAQALLAAGRESEAAAELQAVLDANPGSMEALLDLATLEGRGGDLEGAIGRLTTALEAAATPDSRALLSFQIAGWWQTRGDDQRAIEHYNAALDDFPDFKDAHFNLAVALGRQGRTEEAVEHLTRVVELDSGDEQAHLALAQAHASQDGFAESRDALEIGLGDLPDSLMLAAALAQLLLASPDPAVRDANAAIPLAMRVFEAQPTTRNAAMVAAAYGAAGRFPEAAEWQGRVVSEAEKAGLPEAQLERMRADLEAYQQRAGSGS